MRLMVIFIIMSLNFIFQSTLFQHFRVFDVLPNTTLILIVVFSILWGKNKGAVIGLIAGLVQDIVLGSTVGANALIYMLIGISIGRLENSIFKDNSLTPLFFTTLSTIAYHLLFYFIMYITNTQFNFFQLLKQIIVVETIYNAIISIFIYKLIYHLFRHPNLRLRVR